MEVVAEEGHSSSYSSSSSSSRYYSQPFDDTDDGSDADSDVPPSPLRSPGGTSGDAGGGLDGRGARSVAMPKIIEPKNLDLPPFLQQLHTFLNKQSTFNDDMLLQDLEYGVKGSAGSSIHASPGAGEPSGGGRHDSKHLTKRLMEAQNREFRLNLDESKEMARSRDLGLFLQGHHRHSMARSF